MLVLATHLMTPAVVPSDSVSGEITSINHCGRSER